MPTAREVRADLLIGRLKDELKKFDGIKPPDWAYYTKTGSHKERPPIQEDWWYIRAASLLRTLYLRNKPVGVERLRTKYGGRKKRGVRPERFAKGSGHVIRLILQQLESLGFVEKVEGRGRRITPAGVSFLDRVASQIIRELNLTPGRVMPP